MWIFARPAVDHTSYTLWYRYLNERCKAVARLSPIDPARKEVNHVFERALVFMHKVLSFYNLINRLMLWM